MVTFRHNIAYRIDSFVDSLDISVTIKILHGDIILNRSNNSLISIETSAPQQVGGFTIKHYFGISNIATCRQKRFPIGSLANNRMSNHVSYWLSHNN